MKNFKTFSLGIAMLISFVTFAQEATPFKTYNTERTITGTVSEGGLPLPGVSVIVKGTTQGTQTDLDGKYKIKAKTGEELVFSFIGMKSKTVKVEGHDSINVTLVNETVQQDQVVLRCMGIKKRQDRVTNSTTPVKYFTLIENTNAVESTAGKASGVQVDTTSKGENPNSKTIFRCGRSINSSNKALVLIDNKIVSSKAVEQLNPDYVESVNVIKGKQGAALYGEQGANGVILINTKSNLSDKDKKKLKALLDKDAGNTKPLAQKEAAE